MKYSMNDCITIKQEISPIPADVDVKIIKVNEENGTYDIAAINEPILMAENITEETLEFAENI